MIRVAVDANCLAWSWGGIPKYVDRIVTQLAGDDRLELVLLGNASGPFAGIEGVTEVRRRVRGGTAWRHAFVVPWLLRERPDVFWAPETIAAHAVPVPLVVTVHDVAALLLAGIKPRLHRLAYRTAVRRAVKRADRVIAVSATTAADVGRLWNVTESVCVIPNGIDDAFTPGSREAAAAVVRERFGISTPYVLAVGSIEPRKGLDVLIDAHAEARRAGLPWEVVLGGATGFGGESLVARARAAGVRVLGRVSEGADLVALYRAADVLAAPSLYEGFGLTPLEAMACGTPPVIAAGSGGLEETSGPASVVVQERTPLAWVRAIEGARGEREALVARGLEHARRFRWPHVAEQVCDVLVDAATQSRGRWRKETTPR